MQDLSSPFVTSKAVHLGEAAALYDHREALKEALRSLPVSETQELMLRQRECIEYPTDPVSNLPLHLSTPEESTDAVTRFKVWCSDLGNLMAINAPHLSKLCKVGIDALWYGSQRYPSPGKMEANLAKISREALSMLAPYARENYLPCINDKFWADTIWTVFLRLNETNFCARSLAGKQLEYEVSCIFGFEHSLVGTSIDDIFRIAVGLKEVKAMDLSWPQRNLLQQAVGSSIEEVLPRIEPRKLRAMMIGNKPWVFSTDEVVVVEGVQIVPLYRADEYDCNILLSVGEERTVGYIMLQDATGVRFHNSSQAVADLKKIQSVENATRFLQICR